MLLSAVWPTAARAACSSPAGIAGDITYNGDYHVLQYCNNVKWVAMTTTVNLPTTNGLVGYWKLDDGSGTSAVDSSGMGNTGTLTNGPVWTTGGYANGAVNLDGVDDYIDLGNGSAANLTSQVTLSAWIYPLAWHAVDGLFMKDVSTMPYGLLQWGGLKMRVTIGGTGHDVGTTAPALGVWTHIAGTYDGSTSKIYVNGVLKNSLAVSGTLDTRAEHLVIGRQTATYPFNGYVDDARVYNRALSDTEIAAIYNWHVSPPSSGLIHQWKLDENGGTTAVDTAGGANATLAGTATFTSAGKLAGALSVLFDGTTRSASLTTPFDITGKSALTMSVWFNKQYSWTGMEIGQNTSGQLDSIIIQPWSDSNIYALIGVAGLGSSAVAAPAPATGSWHLATMVFDGTQVGTANRLKLYIDGVQPTLTYSGAAAPANTPAAANGFYIGMTPAGAASEGGKIDDLRIYNRALSADEVYGLYRTSSPVCSSPSGYEGTYIYNSDFHVLQFCDNTSWRPLGPVPGAGGAGCSNPAGGERDLIYSDSTKGSGVMQYCDGLSWIRLGGPSIPTGGLVGYWKLDETSGTSAADSSGGGNTGTLTNGPVWATGGRDSGALTFDGVDDYVNLGTSTSLAGGAAVTVSAWVKPTGSNGEIIARRDVSQTFMSWELLIAGGKAKFTNMTSSGYNPDYTVTSNATISTGVWTHIAGVYTNADGVLRIYVNGVADGTTNGSGTISSAAGVKTYMGAYSNGSSAPTNPFAGTIDDVRVYNRALSPQEIWQLYNGT